MRASWKLYKDRMFELFVRITILKELYEVCSNGNFMSKCKTCTVYRFAVTDYQIIINLAYFQARIVLLLL
jgi:hypothetical protein